MGSKTVLCTFKKRIRALELAIDRVGNCTCRRGGTTIYHTAAELQAILAIRCPVHGFRELGNLVWFPPAMPLSAEDQQLCKCPPSATRDFLANQRGLLTDTEQEEECHKLDEEFSEDAGKRFAADQAEVKRLIIQYERQKQSTLPRGGNSADKNES